MNSQTPSAWIAQFAGQSTPWRAELAELTTDPAIAAELGKICDAAEKILAPVAPELLTITGPMDLIGAPREAPENAGATVPGILLAQYGAYLDVRETLSEPAEAVGHSQGVLAVAMLHDDHAQIFALARLIGAAATRETLVEGASRRGDHTPMVSVKGENLVDVDLPGDVALAIKNSPTSEVLSGVPESLEAALSALKVEGEYLDVAAPFHNPLLEPAVAQVLEWVKACGISLPDAADLTKAVLTEGLDWAAELNEKVPAGATVVNLGPGTGLARLAAENFAGAGVRYIEAGTAEARDALASGTPRESVTQDWSAYAPTASIVGGRKTVDTAFTRLTGRSAILVGGMTPTTVEPEIVAAAANAGHWVEMAGGGQVTEDILNEHLDRLGQLLEPGRTAQFNAMFLDPYLWGMHFGSRRAVSKKRAAGAPLDGVVVSAGIPEFEEAVELVERLHSEGFPYVAFKPGTVAQIRQVVQIARELGEKGVTAPLIAMIEDGQAGGHHSWESLPELLLPTYAQLREAGVVVCAGGGLGDPERAADYLDGSWSRAYGRRPMPVDGVFIGTPLMASAEAATSPAVKDLLVATPGISEGWVHRGEIRGGMTSGLSQLHADLYEIANSSAAASKLLAEIPAEEIDARRDEIIEAIDKTAKPYFGDVEAMTYRQMLERYVELAYPWVDRSMEARFIDLLQRTEARLSEVDHGPIESLFADGVEDPGHAIEALACAYPAAESVLVTPVDAAFFVELSRKYPKPVPFVPVIDAEIVRRWGTDNLWQSHDSRYAADEVRIIPGPVSVASITEANVPTADILAAYEDAAAARLGEGKPAFSRLARTEEEYFGTARYVVWRGNLVPNPALIEGSRLLRAGDSPTSEGSHAAESSHAVEEAASGGEWEVLVPFDSVWDGTETVTHRVREIRVPLVAPSGAASGAYPLVDDARLSAAMRGLLEATAGVGSTTVGGTPVDCLPGDGEAFYFEFGRDAAASHALVCKPADAVGAGAVPSALFGSCWPAIYGAIGSTTRDGYPVIEGLLSTVHLDHSERIAVALDELTGTLTATSHVTGVADTAAGRVIGVDTRVVDGDGREVAFFADRFALRGRAGDEQLEDPQARAGVGDVVETPRSVLGSMKVKAPTDMTAFAIVSGDYNPIHTSRRGAELAGLDEPIVHGMWLCAAAEYATQKIAGTRILGWTYRMFGMVGLGDSVDVRVERVGRIREGGLALEVSCTVDGVLVATATAAVEAPSTAYLYPGQGVQSQGMALDERNESAAARAVWERADKHTRERLGFSILALVRDNPRELVAGGVRYYHPEGLLNLTQFTQVALATVAAAQTERLAAEGALVEGAMFAGHSLGEYTALSSYGRVFPLEALLEIVFQRGSTMHNLVPRDAQGRSNYRMGALRPSQFGVSDVVGYVESISEETGEFLEVVNLNIEGQQYAVAGTVAGLEALERDANARAKAAGGKRPFILVPGIDVPFHSRVLRNGVDDFRELLEDLLPEKIEADALVGRYIPNLVARPFELTEDFARLILDVAPSTMVAELVEDFDGLLERDPYRVIRTLLIELLAWQFASPVQWIRTQNVLLEKGVREWVEVGLATAPTLANIGARTVAQAGADVTVFNVARDSQRVRREDVAVEVDDAGESSRDDAGVGGTTNADDGSHGSPAASAPEAPSPHATKENEAAQAAAEPAAPATPPATAAGPVDDLPFTAADSLDALLALHTKLRPEQIVDADTIETLTNGVSSKRNQVLMDLTSEFGLASMDGAAEAPMTKLRAGVLAGAHGYKPFGAVLSEAISGRLRQIAGAAGAKPQRLAEYLGSAWGLGEGWANHVATAIVLGSREGKSLRGGELATIAPSKKFDAMIDEAVAQVAAARGIAVAKASSGGGSGAMVDSAALEEITGKMTDALAATARELLARLGKEAPAPQADGENTEDVALRVAVSAELGEGWEKFVTPAFSPERAVRLCDRWATAREDVARIAAGLDVDGNFESVGEEVAKQARWHAKHRPEHAERLLEIAAAAEDDAPGQYTGKVAVVTGASPKSIAASVVEKFLAGGATVVVTTSRLDSGRLNWAAELYRRNARGDAELWVVPANLGSLRDIDGLIEWIATEQRVTLGASTKLLKPAFVPDFLFPFAAPPVRGTLDEAGAAAENQARVLLWGVERLIGGLSRIGVDTHVGHRLHVVLPGSPNRGTFGGDGAYGEVKAALDAIANKWANEPWGRRTSIAHALIGWVKGTNLMGHNDPLVAAVEAAGVHVWSANEVAERLLGLCADDALESATRAPVKEDLTGGLDKVNLRELAKGIKLPDAPDKSEGAPTIGALATPAGAARGRTPGRGAFAGGTARPEDLVVVVGVGEAGPWGSSRTRLAAELGIQGTGEVEMTAAGVLELAWMMSLLEWHDTPKAGWYDTSGNLVPEEEIYERYRDEVVARCGIRAFVDDGPLVNLGSIDVAEVRLESDVTFTVADEAAAESLVEADPENTSAALVDDEWTVTRKAGSLTYVPRRTTLSRVVGAQFPSDFDPAHWGIPASMIESVDRMAIWNLMTTVDAFIGAGFTPGELLRNVHPNEVASTQGTGFGGMSSMRQFYLNRFTGNPRPQDLLQETLGNVIAAHTMQSYVGGYGSMIHPVGACATAAVSVEEGADKIACGKATFVVAGGIDDIGLESITGFGDMTATADSAAMARQGIDERFYSRAGDLRRGGFVEAQGGGTVLLARGDFALEMGLPVLAVVAHAQSYADGAHTSIPAPGLGALAVGRGGKDARFVKKLAALGLTPDDISVVSKHDTSTNANDPNEAELHVRLAKAIGRSEGNPLYVVSQKSLTGHAKGGAALFQLAGLTQILASGLIPGNKALNCLDPVFENDPYLVWLRSPFQHDGVKAGLITSLGFGHVSAFIALASPDAFEAAVVREHGDEAADEWRRRADERSHAGAVRLEKAMLGKAELFEGIKDRRFAGDVHEDEAAMLLDPSARLGADGFYPRVKAADDE